VSPVPLDWRASGSEIKEERAMAENDSARKEPVPGCCCCAGGLSSREAKGFQILALSAIVAALAVATAIVMHAVK
jgi:hypothetical protein